MDVITVCLKLFSYVSRQEQVRWGKFWQIQMHMECLSVLFLQILTVLIN